MYNHNLLLGYRHTYFIQQPIICLNVLILYLETFGWSSECFFRKASYASKFASSIISWVYVTR